MKRILFALWFALLAPAANVLNLSKTPYEVFLCGVDFAQVVGTDTMTLTSVTARNSSTGADATSLIVAASPVPAIVSGTKKVAFAIQGGVSSQTYTVIVRVVDTTTTEQFEGQIKVAVQQ